MRRLGQPAGTFTTIALSNMLYDSGSHRGYGATVQSDKTWSISVKIGSSTETLTMRMKVGYNSSNWYWNIYIDGTQVDGGSDNDESGRTYSGSKALHGITFSYNMTYGGEDYQDATLWHISGDYYYSISVDVAGYAKAVTLDTTDIISIITVGDSMKIPSATLTG